jgi:hypothetical protein
VRTPLQLLDDLGHVEQLRPKPVIEDEHGLDERTRQCDVRDRPGGRCHLDRFEADDVAWNERTGAPLKGRVSVTVEN